MRRSLPLLAALSLIALSTSVAQAACPVSSQYCQAGPAEAGQKLDLAPPKIQAQMRQQFLPQCEQAMVQGMGTAAKPVSKAFCTCSVDAILATPGEWRVLREVGGENPKNVAKTHVDLANQTQSQEKACMYAIAAGTGMIAPKSDAAPAPQVGNGPLGLSGGTPLPPSQNPNFAGGMGSLLGAPYTPGGTGN